MFFCLRRLFLDAYVLCLTNSMALFSRLFEIGFHPFHVRPRLEYGKPACSPNLLAGINHSKRIQRFVTRLVTGIRHLPYRRHGAGLITSFEMLVGLLDVNPSFFTSLPLDAALADSATRHFKVRATTEGKGRPFRWGLWNAGISSRFPSLQLLLSIFSGKGWGTLGQKSFPNCPIDWPLISPTHKHPNPNPPAYHPVEIAISLCYPTPCFVFAVTSGPLWPTIYHYKSWSL